MPGRSRSCLPSRRETASGQVPTVSAAVRYARILKAFSPLISSRSAISPRTCAIGPLSTCEAVLLEPEREQARAAGPERVLDGRLAIRRAVAEQAAAAAGA